MSSDPPPFERRSSGGRYPALVVCDHASCDIPADLHGLGLPEHERRRHIGWDIGALDLATRLSEQLDLPLVAARYSRLVIDCNRHLDDATSIVAVSDHTVVPGNQGVTRDERRRRARGYFEPYHAAIADELRSLEQHCEAPALIAIHSFTPSMAGVDRPWHCGILWDRDPRLPVPLMAALSHVSGIRVGDNQPYSGRHPEDYTIERHAECHGRPHVCIEIRQDQLQNEAGLDRWTTILSEALSPLLAQPGLYRAEEPYRPARRGAGL